MTLEEILIEGGFDPEELKSKGLWDNVVATVSLIIDATIEEASAFADETGSNSMNECMHNAKYRILPEE